MGTDEVKQTVAQGKLKEFVDHSIKEAEKKLIQDALLLKKKLTATD